MKKAVVSAITDSSKPIPAINTEGNIIWIFL
jgi:hypothetical protein